MNRYDKIFLEMLKIVAAGSKLSKPAQALLDKGGMLLAKGFDEDALAAFSAEREALNG